jgi:hypothetical protein
LQDQAKQSAHVDRIAAAVEQSGYDGIEIDYPAVDSALKSNFTSFVQALATRLHQSKKKLIVRAPLPRREGNAWNVLAYDWGQLGRNADFLVMVAEKDQSIYRTRVPEAVKYLVSQVPDSKRLILEVTPLSEMKNEQGQVSTISTLDALSIAGQINVRDADQIYGGSDVTVSADNINRESGSGPDWTPQGVVTFQYRADDGQRSVWIENQFSVGYKLEIIQLDKLGGVAVDDASANGANADVWPAIAQFQSTGSPLLERPNPQSLRPTWLADGRPIPDAGSRAQITWHAPLDPGRHTLAVIVSEGTIRVQNATPVAVLQGTPPAGATPSARSSPTPAPARSSATRAAPSTTRAAPSATRTSGR